MKETKSPKMRPRCCEQILYRPGSRWGALHAQGQTDRFYCFCFYFYLQHGCKIMRNLADKETKHTQGLQDKPPVNFPLWLVIFSLVYSECLWLNCTQSLKHAEYSGSGSRLQLPQPVTLCWLTSPSRFPRPQHVGLNLINTVACCVFCRGLLKGLSTSAVSTVNES